MRKALLLLACLQLVGCSVVLGDHPFSSRERGKGHLDKTPRVEILRGQAPETCMTGEKTPLVYFIKLLWMPPTEVWVSANGGPEQRLFGTQLTVNVKAHNQRGFLSYHTLKVRVGQKIYEETTVVVDCLGLGR